MLALNESKKYDSSHVFTNWTLKKMNPLFENALIFCAGEYVVVLIVFKICTKIMINFRFSEAYF